MHGAVRVLVRNMGRGVRLKRDGREWHCLNQRDIRGNCKTLTEK